MKKDVILALIIGLSIGALIAVLAVKLPTLLEKNDTGEKIAKKDENVPPSVTQKELTLEIKEPKNESIFENNTTTLKGSVNPETSVIIESQLESIVVESDKNGDFSSNIKLTEGGNPVYVTSIVSSGNSETKIVNVYYTKESL